MPFADVEIDYLHFFLALQNELQYCCAKHALTAPIMPLHCVNILVSFNPITPEFKRLEYAVFATTYLTTI